MPLRAGDRLGPYEIVSLLGAGGMGEVYRGFDPRLGRQVAIKVLSAETANDPSLRARFEVEARAASVLNHPNIVSVYDFGNQDGLMYIVSELVDGTQLKGEKLAPRKAVELGAQIADGLAAAHAAGITHRDMKPDNVMITGDGRAKILDFGLAKRGGTGISESDATLSTTQTRPGMMLGTVGYMSPEQVRAKDVDYRTDLFSFGLVLYEMLAGRKAFGGDSAISMLNAILNSEPPELPDDVPIGVKQIVAHCLEKNPDQRYQSARDLAFALRAQVSGVRSGLITGAFNAKPAQPWYKLKTTWLSVALGLGVVGAYFLGRSRLEKPVEPQFHQLTFRRGFVSGARFTPDQVSVAYSAGWSGDPAQMFTTRLDSPESQSAGNRAAHVFAVSTKSELALGMNVQFTNMGPVADLYTAPLLSGEPKKVASGVSAADWEPNTDRMLIVRSVGNARQLEFPPETVLYTTGGWISSPRFSPDGKQIAFLDHPIAGSQRGSLMVMPAAGGTAPKALVQAREVLSGLVWRPDGQEIWFGSAKSGEANEVDAVALTGNAPPRVVLVTPNRLQLRDIAKDNSLLFTTGERYTTISGPTRTDMLYKPLEWFSGSSPRDLTLDGQRLLFTETSRAAGPNSTIYLRPLDGSAPQKIGEGDAQAIYADGKKVLAIAQTPEPQILLYSLESSEVQKLGGLFGTLRGAAITPNGELIVVESSGPKGSDLWTRKIGETQQTKLHDSASIAGKAISPDGASVVALGHDGKLVLYPIDGGAPRTIYNLVDGDRFIRWHSDGKAIFVYNPHRWPVKVEKVEIAQGGKREVVREIAITDPTGVTNVDAVITPDGGTIVLGINREYSHLQVVHGLR